MATHRKNWVLCEAALETSTNDDIKKFCQTHGEGSWLNEPQVNENCGSYDHRIVDGLCCSCAEIKEIIEIPARVDRSLMDKFNWHFSCRAIIHE